MAEGIVEDLLGGEEIDRADSDVDSTPADPTAVALAMDAARSDPVLSHKAGLYLDQQRELVEEQRALVRLRLRYFESDAELADGAARRKRFLDRLKIGFQSGAAAAALLLATGAAIMIFDAFSTRAVVVDAFDAPPALASRGVNGKVVAGGVLDVLQRLRDATRGETQGLATQTAWSSDVKIEVPETGVSIGEIDRLLRARFGHDLHIGGALVQTETGDLALTVRGDDVPPMTFVGKPGDLEQLSNRAGEYIYGRSQPYAYVVFLVSSGRSADAVAFLPGGFARADTDVLRGKLATAWGIALQALNQPALAIEKYKIAIALAPSDWAPRNNIIGAALLAEGEEAAWRESKTFLRAVAAAPKKDRPQQRQLVNAAQTTWDLPLVRDGLLDDAAHNRGTGASAVIVGPGIADNYALMHDPLMAARYMAASDPEDAITEAEVLLLQAYGALDRGDPAAAISPMQAYWAAWRSNTNLQTTNLDNQCFLGLAQGLAGRMADAEETFKQSGRWSRCYAFHGDVLERAGDHAGADRTWAEGLAVGPDLPLVYLHRGLAELNRGDLAKATIDLTTANAKAPHFADPLKSWGDVLMRQDRYKEALAKYNEALKYAPAWAALIKARSIAAAK